MTVSESKVCKKCGESKGLHDFYISPRNRGGYSVCCKVCTCVGNRASRNAHLSARRAHDRERNKKRPAFPMTSEQYRLRSQVARLKSPEKTEARYQMKYAIRTGRLVRQPCEVCGIAQTDGHHEDYAKPLEVRWFCRAHHMELHRKPA